MLALNVGVAMLGSGCTDTGSPEDDVGCETRLDFTEKSNADPTSPAPGVMTVTGHFFSTESVVVRYTDPATGEVQSAIVTPPTDRTSITFTGLPSGTITYLFTLSCAQGTHVVGKKTVTVK